MPHDDDVPHGRRATDRAGGVTERRNASLMITLVIVQLVVTTAGGVTALAAWLGQSNSTQTRVNDLPQQLAEVKKDVTNKIIDLQAANNAQFTAISAAIAGLPILNASLPQLTERVSRVEQRLDTVQATSVQTQADLKAALLRGIERQRIP